MSTKKRGSEYDIPRKYPCGRDGMLGYPAGDADAFEMNDAGWDRPLPKPGDAPMSELAVPGRQTITPDLASQMLAQAMYRVLRDGHGAIVATWDEGRWWTPDESEAFVAQLIAEHEQST
jgi:hypothetical protein